MEQNCQNLNKTMKCVNKFQTRIGILADDYIDWYCDSAIMFGGFGTYYPSCNKPDINTCGNIAGCSADNGDVDIKAIGYILIH